MREAGGEDAARISITFATLQGAITYALRRNARAG
jgi:hypothetical protein